MFFHSQRIHGSYLCTLLFHHSAHRGCYYKHRYSNKYHNKHIRKCFMLGNFTIKSCNSHNRIFINHRCIIIIYCFCNFFLSCKCRIISCLYQHLRIWHNICKFFIIHFVYCLIQHILCNILYCHSFC